MAASPCMSDRVPTADVSAIVAAVNDIAADRGLSVEDLAGHARLGVGAFLRRSEDRFPFTLDELDRIANALGMTLFELVERAAEYVGECAPPSLASDEEFEAALERGELQGWAMQSA